MQDFWPAVDRLLSWLLVPATLYGAGGALMHSARRGKPWGQVAFEVMGGAVVANVVCPLVQENTPETWHYTLFFLVGWGGLELVGQAYGLAVKLGRKWIERKFGQ